MLVLGLTGLNVGWTCLELVELCFEMHPNVTESNHIADSGLV